MTLTCQVLLDLVRRLAVPLQRRHRVADRALVHHLLQHLGEIRIVVFDRFSSSSWPPHSPFLRCELAPATEFADSLQNRWLRETTLFHHSLDATSPTPQCFASYEPASLRFVKTRQDFPEQANVLLDVGCNHAPSIAQKHS